MTEKQRYFRKASLKLWGIMGVINMRAGLSPQSDPVKWIPGSDADADANLSPLNCN